MTKFSILNSYNSNFLIAHGRSYQMQIFVSVISEYRPSFCIRQIDFSYCLVYSQASESTRFRLSPYSEFSIHIKEGKLLESRCLPRASLERFAFYTRSCCCQVRFYLRFSLIWSFSLITSSISCLFLAKTSFLFCLMLDSKNKQEELRICSLNCLTSFFLLSITFLDSSITSLRFCMYSDWTLRMTLNFSIWDLIFSICWFSFFSRSCRRRIRFWIISCCFCVSFRRFIALIISTPSLFIFTLILEPFDATKMMWGWSQVKKISLTANQIIYIFC